MPKYVAQALKQKVFKENSNKKLIEMHFNR